jgi:hypothetical protein
MWKEWTANISIVCSNFSYLSFYHLVWYGHYFAFFSTHHIQQVKLPIEILLYHFLMKIKKTTSICWYINYPVMLIDIFCIAFITVKVIHVVTCNSFKYLGLNDFKNWNWQWIGNWYRSQKKIAQHLGNALHNLFRILNYIELPIYQKCKLFDSLVSPILNFGSEIWVMHLAIDIENVHTKFLRRMLGVKTSTTTENLLEKPMSYIRKINMIKYWVKILYQDKLSLHKKVYMRLETDC